VLACHGGQHGIAGPQGSSRYIIVNSMLQEPAATRTTVTAPTLAPLAVTVANDKSRDHYRQIDFCWDYYLNFSSTTLQILHSPILPFSHSPHLTNHAELLYHLFLFLPTLPLGRPANFQKRGLVWRETSFGPTNSNFQPKANCSVLKASSAASLLYLLHMSFIVYFHSCLSRCHVDRHKPNSAIRYYFSRFGTECTRFPHGYPLCGGKRGLRHLSINFLVCTPSIRISLGSRVRRPVEPPAT
jgi:hypothetical protein